MPVTLISFDDPPARIAITKVDGILPNGRFFLDFTRAIVVRRYFGIPHIKVGFINNYIGFKLGALVPVIHERQKEGEFVVGVGVNDGYFMDILHLWKERYPARPIEVSEPAGGIEVIGHFGAQFPTDCQTTG